MTTHSLSLRGRNPSERRGNPSCLEGTRMGLSLRLLDHSGSPRPRGARDDKVRGKDVVVRLQHALCHCEEGTQVTDAAIHRVSHYTYDLSLTLLDHSGSPRAFSPRDDKILYAGAPRAWHGPFGLSPLWSKPVPLRLSFPPCPSSFRT